ncbi:DUF2073 domain-containing protein [Candidatus Woesearchaeota archaeon]|nr:DUF2073 domain-containing protein [Candidatus Woesearchaeota archaeon]
MLTIQYIPHSELLNLDSTSKIKRILNLVKEEKIVMVEGRLKKTEEAELIQKTMEIIDQKFKGIEIASIDPQETSVLKKFVFNMLLGDRSGVTLIGPASVVKSIKKDPNKIQLLTTGSSTTNKKRKTKNKK